jgi:hypothetical protein
MSSELVAALVGAIAGGIIALFGGIAQVFIQGWISNRGKITYDLAPPQLLFSISAFGVDLEGGLSIVEGAVDRGTWEEARTYYLSVSSSSAERKEPARWRHLRAEIYFTVNFLNTKGTNAALLEYSIQFLKGNQTVLTLQPRARLGPQELYEGQGASLAANDVTAMSMDYGLSEQETEEVLKEADSVQFTARLSTGRDIKVELVRLSQDPKRIQKGDAV